jgi:glycerol uptake facilitator-like aquaporin
LECSNDKEALHCPSASKPQALDVVQRFVLEALGTVVTLLRTLSTGARGGKEIAVALSAKCMMMMMMTIIIIIIQVYIYRG